MSRPFGSPPGKPSSCPWDGPQENGAGSVLGVCVLDGIANALLRQRRLRPRGQTRSSAQKARSLGCPWVFRYHHRVQQPRDQGGAAKRNAPPNPPSCTSIDSPSRNLAVSGRLQAIDIWPSWPIWYPQRPSLAPPPRRAASRRWLSHARPEKPTFCHCRVGCGRKRAVRLGGAVCIAFV
jgi:hypothetical protein